MVNEDIIKALFNKRKEPNTHAEKMAHFYGIRGLSYITTGDYNRATENLNKAMSLVPEDAYYPYLLGEVAVGCLDSENSVKYFKQALRLASDEKLIKYRLAEILVILQRFDEAFELDPNDEYILHLILLVVFKRCGECRMCGTCCKGNYLFYMDKKIISEEDFRNVCKEDSCWNDSGRFVSRIFCIR